MVRGYQTRRRYRQIRAVYLIMAAYRRYKLRSYLLHVINVFRGVRSMKDLGKSLRWPAPPVVLAPFVAKLKIVHNRWRAGVILSRMPQHLRSAWF